MACAQPCNRICTTVINHSRLSCVNFLLHKFLIFVTLRDFRLPPRSKLDICIYGTLRSVDCYLFTDVSGQNICLVFKGRTVRRLKLGAMSFFSEI